MEEYAARYDVTTAESLRQLIRRGYDSWQNERADTEGYGHSRPVSLVWDLPPILASALGVAGVSLLTTIEFAPVAGMLLGVVVAPIVSVVAP